MKGDGGIKKRKDGRTRNKKKSLPILVSRLMQITAAPPETVIQQHEPNLKLITRHHVALSPFVIDLSPTPTVLAITLPSPVMQRSPIDILNDLHVSLEDVYGQLEHEEQKHHLLDVVPFLSRPAHDILWEDIENGAGQLFNTLELPESDATLPDVDDKLYTLDDVFASSKITPPPRLPIRLHPSWKHAVASFVGMSFLFVLPISAMKQIESAKQTRVDVEAAGLAAMSNLKLGAGAFKTSNYGLAEDDFSRAQEDFLTAKQTIDTLSLSVEMLSRAWPQTHAQIETAEALVASGQHLANAGELLSAALNAIRTSGADTLTVKLDILSSYVERMRPEIKVAADALQGIELDQMDGALGEDLSLMQSALPKLTQALINLDQFYGTIRLLLGAEGPMRYLILFQNNTEVRPTGGFIGSYAEITVRDGAIEKIVIPSGGSYDLQGALTEFVKAPEPLQLLNARWEFQDGNWFPDFPESAKKLIWFYDHAGGPTVDGVIAVNATSVAELLSLTGAIDMPEYDRTIDSENFLFETQKIVEMEYDKQENRPKQFLADLAPRLLSRIQSQDTMSFLRVLQQVTTAFGTKEAQVYLRDPQQQQLVDALGWSGRVQATDGDYLMVVDANLGGGKTDLVVDENVDLNIAINADGTIDDTVTITRKHRGLTGAMFTGVNNVDYVRVYVPSGSTLLRAEGDFAPPATELYETPNASLSPDEELALVTGKMTTEPMSGTRINEEFGKTVFGNWMQTKPGSSSTISYTYRLPLTVESLQQRHSLFGRLKAAVGIDGVERYALLIQKQSGVLGRTVNAHLRLPENTSIIWVSDEALSSEEGATTKNGTDAYWGALFE